MSSFFINDHIDILMEVMKRLDGQSLCVATCVCRLWSTLARTEAIWEQLCFRHVSSPPPSSVRSIVLALGGYKRLYMVFLRRRPLSRTRDELQLSLSLFCIHYYERLGLSDADADCDPDCSTSSLMFLSKPVNV